MKKYQTVLPLLIVFQACSFFQNETASEISPCTTGAENIYYPQEQLGDLFHRVQLEEVFPDSKYFVDCYPLLSADSIRKIYTSQADDPFFDLKKFVSRYFKEPQGEDASAYQSNREDISNDLLKKWELLTRYPDGDTLLSTLLPLNYPYVVPGGRFREIYYWDSYFTMVGLAATGRYDLIESMIRNFACLINTYGHIPNGNRTYYLSRSQPPFFAAMVKLLMSEKRDYSGIGYLPALKKEYRFWMNNKGLDVFRRTVTINGEILNRYWDDNPVPRPESYREDFLLAGKLDSAGKADLYRNIRAACESGWDFSSRWFADGENPERIKTTSILPVDLNCLMYNMETTLSELYLLIGNKDSAGYYADQAQDRKDLIGNLFWNDSLGLFADYDHDIRQVSAISTLATVYTLYFGIANTDQAERMAAVLRKDFLKAGGLTTTLRNTGQQWDAPNGWAPLEWLAIIGLEKYGFSGLADTVAGRWLYINKKVFEETGKMMEKYNVEDLSTPAGGGEYPLQDGFGWTNGVYLALIRKGYVPRL